MELTFICKFLYSLNFLSINRFEKKKNIDLAISAFAMLRTLEGDALGGQNFADASLTISGNFSCFLKCNCRQTCNICIILFYFLFRGEEENRYVFLHLARLVLVDML